MKQKSVAGKDPAENVIKDIRRVTRRHFSPDDRGRYSENPVCRGPATDRQTLAKTTTSAGVTGSIVIRSSRYQGGAVT